MFAKFLEKRSTLPPCISAWPWTCTCEKQTFPVYTNHYSVTTQDDGTVIASDRNLPIMLPKTMTFIAAAPSVVSQLFRQVTLLKDALRKASDELGIQESPPMPAPIVNAIEIINDALARNSDMEDEYHD